MIRFENGVDRRQLAGHLMWFGLWLAVTFVGVFLLTPDPAGHGTHRQLGLPPCPSVLLFDRPCPGCGLTTSFTATMHARLAEAFRAHPFGPVLYGLFTLSAFANLYGFVTRRRFDTASRAFNVAMAVLALTFIAFGAFRFATVTYPLPGDSAVTMAAPTRDATRTHP